MCVLLNSWIRIIILCGASCSSENPLSRNTWPFPSRFLAPFPLFHSTVHPHATSFVPRWKTPLCTFTPNSCKITRKPHMQCQHHSWGDGPVCPGCSAVKSNHLQTCEQTGCFFFISITLPALIFHCVRMKTYLAIHSLICSLQLQSQCLCTITDNPPSYIKKPPNVHNCLFTF